MLAVDFFMSIKKEFSIDRIISLVSIFIGSYTIVDSKLLYSISFTFIFCVFIIVFIKLFARKKNEISKSGHIGYYDTWELMRENQKYNKNIYVKELIKNIIHSNCNKTANTTIILSGEVREDFTKGIFLTINGGSECSNISNIKYYFLKDTDRLELAKNSHYFNDVEKKLTQNHLISTVQKKSKRFATRLFLPFPQVLNNNTLFQIILSYKWKNSFYGNPNSILYCLDEFPSGVEKLYSNLIFTKKPFAVSLSKVKVKYNKFGIRAIGYECKPHQMITTENNSGNYEIHLEVLKPNNNYVLYRSIDD